MYRDIKNKALDNEKNVVHMMHQTMTDNKDKQKINNCDPTHRTRLTFPYFQSCT